MAFTLTGTIIFLEDTREIPTENGGFKRRSVRLDASTYNRMTGDKYDNYPTFDFMGEKCALLDKFKLNDRVTISFSLKGVKYTDKTTKETRYFNSITGYNIEPYKKNNDAQAQESNSAQDNDNIFVAQSNAPQEQDDDLPF